ncbi:MAG: site-2 protease family protein [bacterium]
MMMSSEVLKLLNYIALLFPAFLFVFTFKGFFRALVAKLMGDRTAQDDGFLSLNPLAHVDLFGITSTLVLIFFLGLFLGNAMPRGTLMLLIIILGIQWSYTPPMNATNFKYYKLGGILTTISGSIGLFLFALILLVGMRLINMTQLAPNILTSLRNLLYMTVELATWFCVVNLVPIPPFAGGQLLYFLLPQSQQHIFEWLENYSTYIFLGLLFLPGVSDIFWGSLYMLQFLVKNFLFNLVF